MTLGNEYDILREEINIFSMKRSTDKSNLQQTLLDFPEQFTKALKFSEEVRAIGDFNKAIITGIGGSTLPGDIVKTFIRSEGEKLPLSINRDYTLPVETDHLTLVLASSYSGNTEEPLSVFEEAGRRGLQVIGFAKNGKLLEFCRENNYPCVRYPDDGPDFQPRYAAGYAFTSMVSVLVHSGLLDDELLDQIKKLPEFLKSLDLEKRGEELAKKIKGSIPIVYSSEKYAMSVARIIKIKFNESSKTQSFFNAFPELNHNEMVGFTNLVGRYTVLIIQDPDDHPRILKRMKITADLLRKKGVNVEMLEMEGKTTLEKMFFALYLGDWIAYYLALLNGVDPTPVEMVEDFKKKLNK